MISETGNLDINEPSENEIETEWQNLTRKVRNFSAFEALGNSWEGKLIMKSYRKDPRLGESMRSVIVDTVLEAAMNNTSERLTEACLLILARKIVEIFKHESLSVYYDRPSLKSQTGRKGPPTGKLPERYRYLLKHQEKHLVQQDHILENNSS